MTFPKQVLAVIVGAAVALPFAVNAQQWAGKGPGPYHASGAGYYGVGNPSARELNELP